MKYLRKFNEGKIGDFIRKKFNSDEETAMGIYKRLPELLPEDITKREIDRTSFYEYVICIDDFNIESCLDFIGFKHKLYVDGVILECSETISKKIFEKLEEIYNKKKVKSAKIKFNKEVSQFRPWERWVLKKIIK